MSENTKQDSVGAAAFAPSPPVEIVPQGPGKEDQAEDVKPSPEDEKDRRELHEQAKEANRATASRLQWRHLMGVGLGVVSIGGLIALVTRALSGIEDLEQAMSYLSDARLSATVWYLLITVCGHGVVTVAGVWGLYQMLKAAERLLLPAHWAEKAMEKDPTVIRFLMGVREPNPLGAGAAAVKDAIAEVKKLTEPPKAPPSGG